MAQEITTQNSVKLAKDAAGEQPVRPFDKVKVKHTGESGFHKAGATEDIHPVLAEKLYTKGYIDYANEADKPESVQRKAKKGAKAEEEPKK